MRSAPSSVSPPTGITRPTERFRPYRAGFGGLVVIAIAALCGLNGCQAVGFVADAVHRAGDHEVKAKYTDLTDRSFAVIVAADRSIQADYPDAMTVLTSELTRRLSENTGASGMVPAERVLKFQYQNPRWVTMSPYEIAQTMKVDRLVFVDIQEYSLTDPGNPYLWNGRASATVSVVESESDLGAETPFREYVSVKFPDNDSTSPQDVPASTIQIALLKRFVDRAAWLFYDHREPNIIEY